MYTKYMKMYDQLNWSLAQIGHNAYSYLIAQCDSDRIYATWSIFHVSLALSRSPHVSWCILSWRGCLGLSSLHSAHKYAAVIQFVSQVKIETNADTQVKIETIERCTSR